MRELYFADNRDLVKWGVLLHLARELGSGSILQVAYLRDTEWETLEIDGAEVPIAASVLSHFRDLTGVSRMTATPRIEVLDAPFVDRGSYLELILQALATRRDGESQIVFLDPDTGLEPAARPGPKHVLESELRRIWDALRQEDVLVLYQHQTNYAGLPWIEVKRIQFETTLGVPHGDAKVARSAMAHDVAFLYCRR